MNNIVIRFETRDGFFEYLPIKKITVERRKVNKKIKFFITAHTETISSTFVESFDSMADVENMIQITFGISDIRETRVNK